MAGDSAFHRSESAFSRRQVGRALTKMRDWARFGVVGASGLVVNEVLFLLLAHVLLVYYLVAAVFATVGSSTWNFLLADRWAFAGRRPASSSGRRYLAFLGINFAL